MVDDPYLTRSLGFLIGDVSRLLRKRFDARAATLGLTRAQWRVLGRLRRREGINQTELAEILDIETMTLGRHIDRLETKGWVERRPDPTDRRAWKLYLDPSVRPILARMRKLSEATRREALEGISEAESEQLIDALLKIKGNMLSLDRDDTGKTGREAGAESSSASTARNRKKVPAEST